MNFLSSVKAHVGNNIIPGGIKSGRDGPCLINPNNPSTYGTTTVEFGSQTRRKKEYNNGLSAGRRLLLAYINGDLQITTEVRGAKIALVVTAYVGNNCLIHASPQMTDGLGFSPDILPRV